MIHYNSAKNIVRICMDTVNSGVDCNGSIYTRYKGVHPDFCSLTEMTFFMDQFFDNINIPQASLKARTFGNGNISEHRKKTVEPDYPSVPNVQGKHATVDVVVQYRQNASWQGVVYWVEKDKTANFRSELEFLKLLESVINDE